MITCYIGLGSNLADPLNQILNAVAAIKSLNFVADIKVSSLYASKPMGPQDQPDYVNAVIQLNCHAGAIELLDSLQKIELEHGRERKDERWGPRTLDLDIILFGEQTLNTERLTVPHYGMKTREFVLYPLAELNPELILPCGTTLQTLLAKVPKNGLTVIKPATAF
ncbi:2-amino-4-hydroxy-6-hydroxymethyldihydropteridine diphosphokinase [Catenovulum sp. 2E275]|uniref:2-amino-4-hydroxy-6- hydroxymethyldihydropteridine diphosphokinase n=1 Tax=Catenovulum sp. 2E275 TaxID=2980497 RepID=UPI0021D15DEF|nr:2-amino-4-hydroxy-6-hydroxymethyldihydropteridine diphosphokinase [Catenovulum sp. 2E275]MCU4675499.1 2-amino-4-hydroxy-6-hydroxymethyldihydropteridine diphosphokinase [Catenovulum sp. 2E275]